MKSSPFLSAGLLAAVAFLSAGVAFANPRASVANGANYLVAADDLTYWHMGGYYRYQSRELSHKMDNLSQDNFGFLIGYDLLDWASIYGIAGTTDSQRKLYGDEADYAFMYGCGLWVNFIDEDILSRLSCETRVRLQGMTQVTFASPEIGGQDCDYTDIYGALTLGIVNELIGNKELWPEAIGVFFGPCYSSLDSDEMDATGDEIGLLLGLDVYVNNRINLSFGYETYGSGDDALSFSLDLRF